MPNLVISLDSDVSHQIIELYVFSPNFNAQLTPEIPMIRAPGALGTQNRHLW